MVTVSLQAVEEVLDLLKVPELLSLVISDLELYRALYDLRALSKMDRSSTPKECLDNDPDFSSYKIDALNVIKDQEQMKKHKLSSIRGIDRIYIDHFYRPAEEFNDDSAEGFQATYLEL